MEIHILQQGLKDLHSHYFTETLLWRDAVSELGYKWNCYAHRGLSPDHCQRTGAIPAFQHEPDLILERNPNFAQLSDFIDLAESFAADCDSALRKTLDADDLVIVPYASETEVFGASLWLRSMASAMRPRLAFIVHRPDFRWSLSKDRRVLSGNMSFWHYAGKRLGMVTQGKTPFIGTLDGRLTKFLQQLVPMKVSDVQCAKFKRGALPDCVSGVAKAFDLGVIGQFRPEHGSRRVPQMLTEIAVAHRHRRFFLQVEHAVERDRILQQFAAAGAAGSIEIVVGDQTVEQFDVNAARCRMLLLPYVADRFRMRTSGVLSVAAGLGIPVIVPADTWMSDRIHEGTASGFVADELTAPFLDRIMSRPQNEWDAMEQKAAALAEPWRREHSMSVALGQILDFCQKHEAALPA